MSKGVPHGEAHRAEPEEAERNKKDCRSNPINNINIILIGKSTNKQTLLFEKILLPDKIITLFVKTWR